MRSRWAGRCVTATGSPAVVLANTAVHQPAGAAAPSLIRLARTPALRHAVCAATPTFVRATTALSRPALPAAVRDAFAAPYATADRRRAVEEFVADIPLEPGHPSAPRPSTRSPRSVRKLDDVPALLLWGPRDPVFSDRYLRDLRARLPHADVQRYERASHLRRWRTPPEAGRRRVGLDRRARPPTGRRPDRARRPAADRPGARRPTSGRDPTCGPALDEPAPATPPPPSWSPAAGRSRGTCSSGRVHELAAGLAEHGVGPGDRVALLVPPGRRPDRRRARLLAGRGVRRGRRPRAGCRPGSRGRCAARTPRTSSAPCPGSRWRPRWGSRAAGSPAGPVPPGCGACSARRSGWRRWPDGAGRCWTAARRSRSRPGRTTRPRSCSRPAPPGRRRAWSTGTGRLGRSSRPLRAAYGISRRRPARRRLRAVRPATGRRSGSPRRSRDGRHRSRARSPPRRWPTPSPPSTRRWSSPRPPRSATSSATAAGLDAGQRDALGRRPAGVVSAGAPVPAALLAARCAALLPNAAAHTPYGMTEALPVTDIALDARSTAAGPGATGVCVGRPLPGVDVAVSPLTADGPRPAADPSSPGVTGEISVAAPHVKDRYDQLWAVQRRSAARRGLAPHRRRRAPRRRRPAVGGGPAGPRGRHGRGPGDAGRRSSSGWRRSPGSTSAAVVGVGPAGTQQVVVVVVAEPGIAARRAGAPPAGRAPLTDAVRAAAGVPVAAVLVADALPVDIRHAAKIDRDPGGGVGRGGCWRASGRGGGRDRRPCAPAAHPCTRPPPVHTATHRARAPRAMHEPGGVCTAGSGAAETEDKPTDERRQRSKEQHRPKQCLRHRGTGRR